MLASNTILFVDDDPENCLAFKAGFRRHFSILLAANATEAIQQIQANNIWIVLSDLRMPGMNGIELLAWTREYDPNIIRILVSGSNHRKEKEVAQAAGIFHQMILKPWKENEVIRLIDSYQ